MFHSSLFKPDGPTPIIPASFNQSRCGAGKTTAALRDMATGTNRYLYAVDRKIVIDDRVATIQAEAANAGTNPLIEIVVTGDHEGAAKPIPVRIAEAIVRLSVHDHAIIVITHAGLTMTDHQTFAGCGARRWNLIVDETPDIHEVRSVDFGPFLIPSLREHYELQEDGAISLRRPIPTREFERPCMAEFRPFHDLLKRGRARASITSWDDAGQPFFVERTWDCTVLGLFDSVSFFADSFSDSITYRVLQSEGVLWEERLLTDHRVWRDRAVTIEYFADSFQASGHQFRKAEMKTELGKVAEYLTTLEIRNHLWTVSREIAAVFDPAEIGGQTVTPKQAGSNQWREWHDATMIYSAKPSPDEVIVHGRRGMSEGDLVRAREGVDIRQFVMRLSLRDPDSTAPVRVRLFDRWQAEQLKAYLDETYGFACQLVRIDVGLTKPIPKKVGRPPNMTAEERKEARAKTQREYHMRTKAKKSLSSG